jgi:2-keto-3-deoxy-L-rhamnonate aldolase RhmA
VVIDTEHSQRSREELSDIVIVLKSNNVAPIIRIPYPVPHYVAMALDAGAEGVLVPYCEDPEVIRQCVAVKRWHPMKGEYLERAANTGVFPSNKTRDYLNARHQDHIIIIGIESEPGYQRLDEILTIDGLDAIFVGPNDMSTSLGIPDEYDNKKYWDVVDGIMKKTNGSGRAVMIHQQNIPDSTRGINAGARFVLHSSDQRLLQNAIQRDFTELRAITEKKLGRSLTVEVADTVETI